MNTGYYHLPLQIFHAASVGYRTIFHLMFKSDLNSYFIHLNNSFISLSVVCERMLCSIYLDQLQWKLLPPLLNKLPPTQNKSIFKGTSLKKKNKLLAKHCIELTVSYSIYRQIMTEIYSNSNTLLIANG